jgi:hypothetical protein
MENFQITLNIPGLDALISAINQLSNGGQPKTTNIVNSTPVMPLPSTQIPQQEYQQYINNCVDPPMQYAPAPQVTPTVQQPGAPMPQMPLQQAPAQTAVPTEIPTYDIASISNACAALMDAGKRADLMQLLGKYGAQALTQLPKDAYGAFVTDLRGMGAKI